MLGLEKFKTYFSGYESNYVVIGGTACTILLEEAGLNFRATKDIDIVIIVESLNRDFAARFWEFIKAGGYENYVGRDKRTFYRFKNPSSPNFPKMIELFSRTPDNFAPAPGTHLLSLYITDDISSLSAILLDEDYYQFLRSGQKNINGVSVLDELRLIPFKAKAWCELTDRSTAGESGLADHIRKHRKDIISLVTLLESTNRVELQGSVRVDMNRFISFMQTEDISEKTTGLREMTANSFCSLLRQIYIIE